MTSSDTLPSFDWLSRIIAEPRRRSGRATLRGTRLAVADVLSMLGSGMSRAEVLADFPELEDADIAACLLHAAALEGATREVALTEHTRDPCG